MHYLDFYPSILRENRKVAKELVVQGKLSPEDFELLVSIDPSPTKKYTGWLARQWVNKTTSGIQSIDNLRNTIEEYDTFLASGKAKTKDIYQFKSFDDLKKEVDELNASGVKSNSELRDDYEIVRDDDNVLIAVPHSHEASRYLGLSKFTYRDCEGGGKDSAWCTTYRVPVHFHGYYSKRGITLYYIRVKNESIINALKTAFPSKKGAMVVVALLVYKSNKSGKSSNGFDGLNDKLSPKEISTFRQIVGI